MPYFKKSYLTSDKMTLFLAVPKTLVKIQIFELWTIVRPYVCPR